MEIKSEVHITDYTSTHLIQIQGKPAKIKVGTHRIIHYINMAQYDTFLHKVMETIKSLPYNNTLIPLIEHELQQTTELIESIKPITIHTRQQRSIDALGKIWKYIAGTPDKEDFDIITQNINSLNKNNNKQTIINSMLNTHINKLISITNNINNQIKNNNVIETEIIITLQTKIRLIKNEIINIKYALQNVKLNIVNSMLLSKQETNIIINIIKENNIHVQNIEEILEISKISVLYNDLSLLYIIKIPITTHDTYTNFLLKPVKKTNKIVKIQFNDIIRNKNEILGIKNPNKVKTSLVVYDKTSLVNISLSTCIPNIINGLNSSCDYTTAYHIPEIEIITPGLIILNNFNDNIIFNKEKHFLNGTFLIKFENETITIKNSNYSNFETISYQAKNTIYQPTPLEKEHINFLSLESLEQLHINNTDQIQNLKVTTTILGYSTFSLSLVIIIAFIILKCLQKENITVKLQELTKPIPESHTNVALWHLPQTKGGGVMLTH